jgi:penicillin amidase
MVFRITLLVAVALAWIGNQPVTPRIEEISVPGLAHPVEIVIDPWGIAHIYAETQADLFFAQGFNAARDRLFQLELWRRKATGTLAEILGPEALQQDIGARLFRFRTDIRRELAHYHPDGEEIVNSFVDGYNAYVAETEKDPSLLPLEFRLLGIQPGRWTPEVVVSRHNGLYRNASDEIKIAQLVREVGPEKTTELLPLSPRIPDLKPASGLELDLLTDEVLELYRSNRVSVKFRPSHIVDAENRVSEVTTRFSPLLRTLDRNSGSNNWVVSGRHTLTGMPFLANDPHRSLQVPSLRYWVHLVAPGWDVIGGGEPALPGVSIGHNAYGAWGLTIFAVDQEDIYVYETHENDPLLYRYLGGWETLEVVREEIFVKESSSVVAELKYTRHGPVFFEDQENHKIYALRAAWLQRGCSPYLASLRIDQARSWEEFREALSFFRTPSENMIWADRDGSIGWQAAGITPLRPNWSGLLPVPGDGRFEWDGFLPIRMLPHVLNPPEGFFATANQNNLPQGYPYDVGFLWSDPFRHARIIEFLNQKRRFSLNDMMQLQQDTVSIPARSLVPMLKDLQPDDPVTREARDLLLSWDFSLNTSSSAAAIYVIWERNLKKRIYELSVPVEAREVVARKSILKVIDWLTSPDGRFGDKPLTERDSFLLDCLEAAAEEVREKFGQRMTDAQLGDQRLHHAWTRHPLSEVVTPAIRKQLDVGPVPRPGNGNTVNMTTDNDNQTSGGTFRIIADVADWDRSLGTNFPGQSGNPKDDHYRDLIEPWAKGKYFPLYYTRPKIESVARAKIVLAPQDR